MFFIAVLPSIVKSAVWKVRYFSDLGKKGKYCTLINVILSSSLHR